MFGIKFHKHNMDYVCHCYQICCKCGEHLWQIIEESEKRFNTENQLKFFKLNGKWYSIDDIISYCRTEKLRFYTKEMGEVVGFEEIKK